MKKLYGLILAFAICLLSFSGMVRTEAADVTVSDNAGVLNSTEKSTVTSRIKTVSNRSGLNIAVFFENSLESINYTSAQAAADDIYDSMFGKNTDGVLFLYCVDSRDFAISVSGLGIDVLYDAALQNTVYAMSGEMQAKNYGNAILAFADSIESYYDSYLAYIEGQNTRKGPNFLGSGIIAVIVGAIAGLIRGGMLKSELKSVSTKTEANDCVRKGSFKLDLRRDIFLYRTVERKRIERKDDTDRTSTTHTSSSGGTHGGISGKM